MNEKRFLERLYGMIQIDSPSLEEKEMSDYLYGYFTDRGLQVEVDDSCRAFGSNGQNVLVHIPGTKEGEAICFNAHMDTVEPGRGIIPVAEDGIVRSGSDTVLGADDKAGIAILMEAYEYLKENQIPHREMYYLFTVGEEIMKGARFCDTSRIHAKYIYALDGGGSPRFLCSACAGKTMLRLSFIGKPAHAGIEIGKGINAICMAADAVSRMEAGQIDSETTVNIASFHAGEERPVVPDHAAVIIEVKSFNQDKIEHQVQQIRKMSEEAAERAGGKVHLEEERICLPLILGEGDYLYDRTEEEIRCLGLEPMVVKTGGSGDINVFAEKGFQCGGLCIGMYEVHTANEYLKLEEVEAAYQIVLKLMTGR